MDLKRSVSLLLLSLCSFIRVEADGFEFGGEALYWRPSLPGVDYDTRGVPMPDPGDNQDTFVVDTVRPTWSWGAGAWAAYVSKGGCSKVSLSGRYIDFSDTDTSSNTIPILTDTFFRAEFFGSQATALLAIRYWTLDFSWTRFFHIDCLSAAWVLCGLRYADIDTRFSVQAGVIIPDAFITGGTGRTEAEFRGVGPELGIGCEQSLFYGFNLFGQLTTAIVPSLHTYSQDTTTVLLPGQTSRFRYNREWSAVPAVDLRLGLAYSFQRRCWSIQGRIGYELDYYWNVYKERLPFSGQPPQFLDVAGISYDRIDEDLGFGGMFLGLMVGF